MMTKGQRASMAACLMGSMVFISIIYVLQGTLLTNIIDRFHLTDSAQGLPSSSASAGAVLALVSSFFMIGKLKKTTLLMLAIAVCTLFLGLLSFLPAFWIFVGFWLLLGIGLGYMDMLLSSCMADLYEGRTGTRMMSLLHMIYGITFMIAPLGIDALLKKGMAWRYIYLYAAAVGGLMLLLLVLVTGLGGKRKQAAIVEDRMNAKDMLELLRHGMLPGLVAATFCHGFALGGLNTWITRYITVALNGEIGSMSLTFMFIGITASRFFMPFLPIPPEKFVRTAGFVSGTILLVAIPFKNPYVMCAGVLLSGLAFGTLLPMILNIGCAATPRSTMFATTAMMLSMYLGQVLVPPIIGALESAVNLHAGMALCGIGMFAVSGCCLAAIPRGYIYGKTDETK